MDAPLLPPRLCGRKSGTGKGSMGPIGELDGERGRSCVSGDDDRSTLLRVHTYLDGRDASPKVTVSCTGRVVSAPSAALIPRDDDLPAVVVMVEHPEPLVSPLREPVMRDQLGEDLGLTHGGNLDHGGPVPVVPDELGPGPPPVPATALRAVHEAIFTSWRRDESESFTAPHTGIGSSIRSG